MLLLLLDLLWHGAIVANVCYVRSVATELNASQGVAPLRRNFPFPAISFFTIMVIFWQTNLRSIT